MEKSNEKSDRVNDEETDREKDEKETEREMNEEKDDIDDVVFEKLLQEGLKSGKLTLDELRMAYGWNHGTMMQNENVTIATDDSEPNSEDEAYNIEVEEYMLEAGYRRIPGTDDWAPADEDDIPDDSGIPNMDCSLAYDKFSCSSQEE